MTDTQSQQIDLFGIDENNCEDVWKDMPEYNNSYLPKPVITVTINFRNKTDYDLFHQLNDTIEVPPCSDSRPVALVDNTSLFLA